MSQLVSNNNPSSSVAVAVAVVAPARKPRGFAALKARGDLAHVREIASRGGRSAHALGLAHTWTRESAAAAGRKGAAARDANRRTQAQAQQPQRAGLTTAA